MQGSSLPTSDTPNSQSKHEEFEGSNPAGPYFQGVEFPETKGSPRTSRPGDSYYLAVLILTTRIGCIHRVLVHAKVHLNLHACTSSSLASPAPTRLRWTRLSALKIRYQMLKNGSNILTPRQSGSPAPSLPDSLTASLPDSVVLWLPGSLATWLHRSLAPWLPLSLAPSLPRSLAPSLPRSLAPSLPRSLAPSLPRTLSL